MEVRTRSGTPPHPTGRSVPPTHDDTKGSGVHGDTQDLPTTHFNEDVYRDPPDSSGSCRYTQKVQRSTWFPTAHPTLPLHRYRFMTVHPVPIDTQNTQRRTRSPPVHRHRPTTTHSAPTGTDIGPQRYTRPSLAHRHRPATSRRRQRKRLWVSPHVSRRRCAQEEPSQKPRHRHKDPEYRPVPSCEGGLNPGTVEDTGMKSLSVGPCPFPPLWVSSPCLPPPPLRLGALSPLLYCPSR